MVKSTIPAGVFRSNGFASSLSALMTRDDLDSSSILLIRTAFRLFFAWVRYAFAANASAFAFSSASASSSAPVSACLAVASAR